MWFSFIAIEISSGMSEPPRKPKPKKTVKINRTSAHQPSPPKADQKPLVKIQKSLAEANKTRKSDEMKEPQSATKPMKRLKKKRDASLDLPSSSQVNNGNGPASSSSALALKIGPAQKEVVEERTAKQGPAPMDIDNLDLTKDSEVSDPPSEADLFRTKEDAILADVSSTSKVISTALPSSSSEPAPDVRQVLASPKKANVSISPVVPEKRMSSPVRSSRSLQSDKDLAKELFGSDESLPTAVSKASESIKQKIPKAKAKLAPPKKAVAFGKLRTEKITSTDEDSEEMSDLESSPSEPDEEEPRSPEYTEESVIKKVKKSLKTPVKKAKAAPKKPVAAKKKKRNREDDLLVFAPRTDYDYDAAQAKFKAQLMDPTKGLAYNLKYGDPCQVFWCGRWYHARAVCYAHASADTLLLKVNYNGWEARYDSYIIVDERVNEDVVRPDEVDIGETRPARSEARLQFDVTGRGAKSHHGLKNADQVKSVVEDGYLLIPLKQKAETVHPYDYNGAEDDETTDDDA